MFQYQAEQNKQNSKYCKTRELRSGNLYRGCDCFRRNGLQQDCPRRECENIKENCLQIPNPACCPSWNTSKWLTATESHRPESFQFTFSSRRILSLVACHIHQWEFLNMRIMVLIADFFSFQYKMNLTVYSLSWNPLNFSYCHCLFLNIIFKSLSLGGSKTSTLSEPRVARWNIISRLWMLSTKWFARWLSENWLRTSERWLSGCSSP